jgi:hypothetical protein
MYWNSILWFLSWPALVVLSYYLVKYVTGKYTDVLEKPLKKQQVQEHSQ